MESLVRELFREVLKQEPPEPFPRMSYRRGAAPLRFDAGPAHRPRAVDVADLVAGSEFKVFAAPAKDPLGRVAALRVPGGAALPRSQIDDDTAYVARYGARGLAYLKPTSAKDAKAQQSPIIKFSTTQPLRGIPRTRHGASTATLVFFGADKASVVNDALGALRLRVGQDLKLVAEGWRPLWVIDFPMFEYDAEAKRWVAMHHPFTFVEECGRAPLTANWASPSRRPTTWCSTARRSWRSVRIHRQELQSAVCELLGIGAEEARSGF